MNEIVEMNNATEAFPAPKFRVGGLVFTPRLTVTEGEFDCPDCLGAGKWTVSTPGGFSFEVSCNRCSGGYGISFAGTRKKPPSLTYRKYIGTTQSLTIGSIRIDTNDADPVSYMCRETGVGSGSVWHERRLYPTVDEAQEAAVKEAEEAAARESERPRAREVEYYSKVRTDSLAVGLSWDEIYHAWDKARGYREFLDTLREDEAAMSRLGDELAECLDDTLRDRDWLVNHPLQALIFAAQSGDMQKIKIALDALPKPLPEKI